MCGIGEGGAERLLGFADEGLGGWEALGGGEKQGLQAGRTMNKAPVVLSGSWSLLRLLGGRII